MSHHLTLTAFNGLNPPKSETGLQQRYWDSRIAIAVAHAAVLGAPALPCRPLL